MKYQKQLLIVCIVLGSIFIRLYKLDGPLTDGHAYRQAQTALTVKSFCETGPNLLDYQTPIFIPPWKEPFEFPLYQYTAYVVHKAGVENVDMACRIADLLYFYASAIFVWLISLKLFRNQKTSILTLFLYLFIPFGIQWSRTAMIEFPSVCFVLMYVYFFWRWIEQPQNVYLWLAAVFGGALAALVKLPSLYAGVMFLAPLLLVKFYHNWKHDHCTIKRSIQKRCTLRFLTLTLAFIGLCFIPLVVGLLWFDHAENIKASNDLSFYVLEKLKTWNFGTLAQRFSIDQWIKLGSHLYNLIPGIILPVILVAIFKITQSNNVNLKRNVLFLLAAVILTPLTFFNLYVIHNYYLCAIFPFYVCALAFLLHYIYQKHIHKPFCKYAFLALCVISFTLTPSAWRFINKTSYDNDPYVSIGKHIEGISKPEEFLIVEDATSHPALLYYANRKGFVSLNMTDTIADVLRKYNYRYFVSPNPEVSMKVLKNYFTMTELSPYQGYRIFKMNAIQSPE